MPKLPRDLSQDDVIKALMKAGGEVTEQGKGSHVAVRMPNGHLAVLPRTIKVGLLASQLRESGMSIQEFIDKL